VSVLLLASALELIEAPFEQDFERLPKAPCHPERSGGFSKRISRTVEGPLSHQQRPEAQRGVSTTTPAQPWKSGASAPRKTVPFAMNDGQALRNVSDFIKATVIQSVPYPVKISEDDQANIANSVPVSGG
jgi:hypothetical protein